MATLATLVVKLTGDISEYEQSMESAAGKMSSVGETLTRTGAGMTAGITLPLVAAGGAAVHFANEFNSGMANVASLGSEASDMIGQWGPMVQDLAVTVGKSTEDMSGGLYNVVSAFGATDESMQLLEINAKAAAGGLSTTTEAINLTSAVTKAYGDTSATAVQQVADLALKTVQLGQTTFPELAASMGGVTPIASSMGVSIEELFAHMATFTGVTGGAAEVSTQLRGAMQAMMAPTEAMNDVIASMGYETAQAAIENEGLAGVLTNVVAAAEATGQPLQAYIGSIEGQTVALALAGGQTETFNEKLGAMAEASGTAEEAFAAQTEGVNATGFAMQQAGIRAQTWAQQIGGQLVPVIGQLMERAQPVVDWISEMIQRFTELSPKTQMIIMGIAAFAAALGPLLAVLGMVASGIGVVVSVLGLLLGPVGLVVVAIVALALAFQTNFGGIRDAANALWGDLQQIFAGIKQIFTGDVQGGLETLKTAFASAFQTLVTTAQTLLADVTRAFVDWVQGTDWNKLGLDVINFIIDGLGSFATLVWNTLEEWDAEFWKWLESVDWEQLGIDVTVAIITGLKEFDQKSAVWLEEVGTKFKTWFQNYDWVALAESIIDGLITGLGNALAAGGRLLTAATDLAKGVWNAIADEIGFGSPAKNFIPLGESIPQAVAVGIGTSDQAVADAVASMAEQMRAEAVTAFAEALQAVSAAVQPGLDALQTISEWKMPGDFANNLEKFSAEIQHFVGTLGGAAYLLEVEGFGAISLAERLAEAIDAVVAIVEGGIMALDAIAGWTLPELGGNIEAFAAAIGEMVNKLAEAAALTDPEALEHAQKFAEAAGALIGIVVPAIDGLAALGAYVGSSNLTAAAEAFKTDLGRALYYIIEALILAQVATQGSLAWAGEVAEAVASVVQIIQPAVDNLVALDAYIGASNLTAAAEAFKTDLVRALHYIIEALILAQVASQGSLAWAGEMAQAVTGVIGIVEPAIEGLVALGAYVTAADLQAAADAFKTDLALVLDEIVEAFVWATVTTGSALEWAGELSVAAQAVLGVVIPAVEAIAAIAAYEYSGDLLLSTFWPAMIITIWALITYLDLATENISEDLMAAAVAASTAAQGVLGVVTPAVEAIAAIAAYEYSGDLSMSSFWEDMQVVIRLMITKLDEVAQSLDQDMRDAAVAVATAAGTVLGIVKTAVEAIAAIAAYESPTDLRLAAEQFATDLIATVHALSDTFLNAQIDESAIAAATALANDILTLGQAANEAMTNVNSMLNESFAAIERMGEFATTAVPGGIRDIMANIIAALQENVPAAGVAGIDFGLAFVQGLTDKLLGGVASIQTTLNEMLVILQGATAPWYEAGVALGQAIVNGIVAGMLGNGDVLAGAAQGMGEGIFRAVEQAMAQMQASGDGGGWGRGGVTVEAGAFQVTINNDMDQAEFEFRMLEILRRLTE